LLETDGDTLIVSVPTREHEGWLRRHYSAQLSNALQDTGVKAVAFRVSEEQVPVAVAI
jgi:chromosomal replication initiation ATPase DnaA